MTAMTRALLFLIIGWLASQTLACASELKITLRFDKRAYKMGDEVHFTVTYENITARSYRILAKERYFVAHLLSMVRRSDSKKAEYVMPGGESTFDIEELIQYVVRLDPHDAVTRNYTARLVSSLPWGYDNAGMGVFLLCDGSAIRLPGFGSYAATSSYDEGAGDPLDQYVKEEPKLWAGEARSDPVFVSIKAK